ncbi:MAG: hypothetical protein ACP5SI_06105 [Chloroflexia bacterium]
MGEWTPELILWIGILVCGALMVIFRDWRITLPALLALYLLLGLLFSRFPFVPQDIALGRLRLSSFGLVKVVTGLAVVAILALTAVSRRWIRLPEGEHPADEVLAARLRWAARRLRPARIGLRERLAAYLLPSSTLALLIAVTYTLAILYPLVRTPVLAEHPLWFYVDLSWYWLALCGLFNVLFAQEVQEVCIGLLLCMASADLLYTTLSRSVGLLAIGLLSTVSILLALGAALFSILFFLRLQRWHLPSAQELD